MKTLLILLTLLNSLKVTTTFANERGNGGDITPSEVHAKQVKLKEVKNQILNFFIDHEHDLSDTFHSFEIGKLINALQSSELKVVTKDLKDRFGIVRTCLNYPNSTLIECNIYKLNEGSSTAPFTLLTHEHLNQIGVEINKNIAFEQRYPISSLIENYLVSDHNYKLAYQELKKKSETIKGHFSLSKEFFLFSSDKFFNKNKDYVERKAVERGETECYLKYKKCTVLYKTLKTNKRKFKLPYDRRKLFKSKVQYTESEVFIKGEGQRVIGDALHVRRPYEKLYKGVVQANSINDVSVNEEARRLRGECYLNGNTMCNLSITQKLDSKFNGNKVFVVVKGYIELKNVAKSYYNNKYYGNESCDSPKDYENIIVNRALTSCESDGYRTCKVVVKKTYHNGRKNLCWTTYAIIGRI